MARVIVRTRVQEFIDRVLRTDMLAATNHFAKLKSVECSFILHGAIVGNQQHQQQAQGIRDKAANLLAILCGQTPGEVKIDPSLADPNIRIMSEAEQRNQEQARISTAAAGTSRTAASMSKGGRQIVSKRNVKKVLSKSDVRKEHEQDNFKKRKEKVERTHELALVKAARGATQLKVDLRNYRMYYFLDKLAEFFLPDVLGAQDIDSMTFKERCYLRRGHSNEISRAALAGRFDVWTKPGTIKPFRPVGRDENPLEAFSTYTISILDLMRFPDVEANLEAMEEPGNFLLNSKLNLIIRPTVSIARPFPKVIKSLDVEPDNLMLMNWFLGQVFNPYMTRHFHPPGPADSIVPDFDVVRPLGNSYIVRADDEHQSRLAQNLAE